MCYNEYSIRAIYNIYICICCCFFPGQPQAPVLPVGFSTALTQTTTLHDKQTIHFDKIITNVGNGYEVQSGIFHAPIKGLYFISVTVFDFYHSSLTVDIVQNGKSLVDLFIDGSGHQNSAMTQTLILQLDKGDRVWVRNKTDGGKLSGSSGQPTGVFNTFSGYCLAYVE